MLKQIRTLIAGLSTPQKILAASAVLVLVAVLAFAGLWAGSTDPVLLAGDVERKDAARILAKLEESGIPVRLENDGRNILVASADLERARALLVAADIGPAAGGGEDVLGSGFTFTTEAEQRVRLRIAKEKDLARSLREFAPVETATVHLVPRKDSFHRAGDEPAKASIILGLRAGAVLPPATADAMARLVANAVEGLTPANVTIMDTRGAVLAGAGDAEGFEAGRILERTRELERYLSEKAETLLARAFGPGKAVVRVNVDLDSERKEMKERRVDPGSKVVLRERVSRQEQSEGGTVPGGPTGTDARLRGASGAAGAGASSGSSTTEDLESSYEYNRTETVTLREMGAIRRLSVGVLLDSSLRDVAAGIEKSVKEAVGFSETRRDGFQVEVVSFVAPAVPDSGAAEEAPASRTLLLAIARPAAAVVGVIVTLLFLRSMLRRARRGLQAALEAETSRSDKVARNDARHTLGQAVERDAASVGRILKNWLYEPAEKS